MNYIWKQVFGNSKFIEIPLGDDEFVLSETHFSFTRLGIFMMLFGGLLGSIFLWYVAVYFCFPYLIHSENVSGDDKFLVIFIIAFLVISELIIMIKHKSRLILTNKRFFIYNHPSFGIYPIGRELISGSERTKILGLLDAVKIKILKYNWATIILWERTHLTEIETCVNQFLDVSSHSKIAGNDSRRILLFERLTFMKRLFDSFKWLILAVIILSIFVYFIR